MACWSYMDWLPAWMDNNAYLSPNRCPGHQRPISNMRSNSASSWPKMPLRREQLELSLPSTPLESRSTSVSEHTTTLLPLEGKRVLVTRTRDQASVLSAQLRTLGAI